MLSLYSIIEAAGWCRQQNEDDKEAAAAASGKLMATQMKAKTKLQDEKKELQAQLDAFAGQGEDLPLGVVVAMSLNSRLCLVTAVRVQMQVLEIIHRNW